VRHPRVRHLLRRLTSSRRAVQIPSFLQDAKGTLRGEDDVKYSYVIIRRGQRPASIEPKLSAFAEMLASLDKADTAKSPLEPASTDTTAVSSGTSGPTVDPAHELTFPRIIAPPMKGSGHITIDVCAPSGAPRPF
jgi:ribosomal protein RSM22 (predicted rRNA methylase)